MGLSRDKTNGQFGKNTSLTPKIKFFKKNKIYARLLMIYIYIYISHSLTTLNM